LGGLDIPGKVPISGRAPTWLWFSQTPLDTWSQREAPDISTPLWCCLTLLSAPPKPGFCNRVGCFALGGSCCLLSLLLGNELGICVFFFVDYQFPDSFPLLFGSRAPSLDACLCFAFWPRFFPPVRFEIFFLLPAIQFFSVRFPLFDGTFRHPLRKGVFCVLLPFFFYFRCFEIEFLHPQRSAPRSFLKETWDCSSTPLFLT